MKYVGYLWGPTATSGTKLGSYVHHAFSQEGVAPEIIEIWAPKIRHQGRVVRQSNKAPSCPLSNCVVMIAKAGRFRNAVDE